MIDIVYEQLGSGQSALGSGTNNAIVGAVSPAASLLISELMILAILTSGF